MTQFTGRSNALKAISMTDDELRVGNYIALFGGKDLEGDHFTPNTDFESSYTKTGMLYVNWEHGFGKKVDGDYSPGPDDVLGYVDWKTSTIDKMGIWVERVLSRRNQYMQYLEKLIEAGLISNSSEAVESGVVRTKSGEIQRWPLRMDTLTVTPMEPRMMTENTLNAMKGLTRSGLRLPEIPSLDRSNVIINAHFDRPPTGEEQLYTDAANALVKAFSRGRKGIEPKPVRVRLMTIPSALKRDGQCSVADPDEFRIIISDRKGSPRKLQVFYHETWHAIDSVDPEHWAELCHDGNEEWTAKQGEKHLAKIGKIARKAAERAAGRNQPNPFKTIELETIEALARYSPAWLKEFQKRSWILPY